MDAADIKTVRYARFTVLGLTQREERYPSDGYPISGDMLRLLPAVPSHPHWTRADAAGLIATRTLSSGT